MYFTGLVVETQGPFLVAVDQRQGLGADRSLHTGHGRAVRGLVQPQSAEAALVQRAQVGSLVAVSRNLPAEQAIETFPLILMM